MKEALLNGELDRFGRDLYDAFVPKKTMNPTITDGENGWRTDGATTDLVPPIPATMYPGWRIDCFRLDRT